MNKCIENSHMQYSENHPKMFSNSHSYLGDPLLCFFFFFGWPCHENNLCYGHLIEAIEFKIFVPNNSLLFYIPAQAPPLEF